jgi:hypothetical protein
MLVGGHYKMMFTNNRMVNCTAYKQQHVIGLISTHHRSIRPPTCKALWDVLQERH